MKNARGRGRADNPAPLVETLEITASNPTPAYPHPRVSVIVPCRNERRHIVACLDSILSNQYPANALEIIVVDGASEDGTRALLEEYAQRSPNVRWLDNPARTAPAALNIGIRNSHGDIVMRMDAHCRYPENYIATLVNWLQVSGADNVGGAWRTLPGSETTIGRAIASAMSHPFGVGNAHFRLGTALPRWVDTVPFGCYRRGVFDRIGLFDEELVRNQDDEFNQRLIQNGGRILLVPDARIDYYARDSIKNVARMYYQYGYFKPLAIRKLGRVGTVRQTVPAAFVLSLGFLLALSPWFLTFRLAFLTVLGLYAIALVVSSIDAGGELGAKVSAGLLLVFPTIHFTYAVGSILGLVRFFLRGAHGTHDTSKVPISR